MAERCWTKTWKLGRIRRFAQKVLLWRLASTRCFMWFLPLENIQRGCKSPSTFDWKTDSKPSSPTAVGVFKLDTHASTTGIFFQNMSVKEKHVICDTWQIQFVDSNDGVFSKSSALEVCFSNALHTISAAWKHLSNSQGLSDRGRGGLGGGRIPWSM